jgi:hypothetical protein
MSGKTRHLHLPSKLQVSPNFTLDSVADSNYRGKCDVGGFLIFEWTLLVIQNDCGQVWQLCTKMYVATL